MLEAPATGRPSRPPPGAPLPSLDGMIALELPLKEARQAWVESFESVYVRNVLRRCGGNVTRAAGSAGVSRRFLQRTIARLGIRPAEVGASEADFTGDDEE
jgi:DNA-binding NtrC family response regulator